MVKGSCVCGDWTYEYEGEPVAVRTAGQNGSTNVIVKNDQFKQLSGADRTYTRKGDSGKNVTYHNCAQCSCIMWVEPESMAGLKIVKSGTIDEQEILNKLKLMKEIYCKNRPDSMPEYPGIPHEETS